VAVLEAVVADPQRRLSSLAGPDEEERAILAGWAHGPAVAGPVPMLAETVAAQARTRPEAPAVMAGAESVSYGQLAARAQRLAARLRRLGVGPEQMVGVCLPRGVDWVVAVVAVWQAGGVYVPLEPGYPPARLALMVADARPRVVISRGGWARALPGAVSLVDLDVDPGSDDDGDGGIVPSGVGPDQLAYVVYTSGSTGTPKGAMVAHGGLANLAADQREAFGLGPGDRVAQLAPAGFDGSLWELAMALGAGACVVVIDPAQEADLGSALAGVTAASMTPSVLATVSPDGLDGLATLVVGAERLGPGAVARWAPGRRMVNAYGPAEATINATLQACRPDPAPPPIGRPIRNTTAWVLDPQLQPVPIGVAGELHLGGVGLARGYLGQPALTAERFVANPFTGDGSRLYRSGDLARWQPDGTLAYLGRADNQIKVRGIRVEPGELETILATHPDIAEAAVIPHTDTDGEVCLVGYVRPQTRQHALTVEELRDFVAQYLPRFEIPSGFVIVDAFPRTVHGKLDVAALPELDRDRGHAVEWVPPTGVVEETVAEVWRDVLHIERVGALDDFFALGGHSLLAARAASQLEATLGVQLPLRAVFEAPRLRGWAAEIDAALGQEVSNLSTEELDELIAGDDPEALP
jgi:amino acid adenylation domain-containing protein